MAIIDDAVSQIEGLGFVVIDGIRDLVYDINSPSEATCGISKLMQWADEHQIHLRTILHQNKSDENTRGHIGTEINNKAETVIQVEKDKDDSSKVYMPDPKTFCHSPSASMTNHFPNFCRTMCRQRRA